MYVFFNVGGVNILCFYLKYYYIIKENFSFTLETIKTNT